MWSRMGLKMIRGLTPYMIFMFGGLRCEPPAASDEVWPFRSDDLRGRPRRKRHFRPFARLRRGSGPEDPLINIVKPFKIEKPPVLFSKWRTGGFFVKRQEKNFQARFTSTFYLTRISTD